ncbi:hypothetical protein Tco_1337283, partial [Tanacetum coccineum]
TSKKQKSTKAPIPSVPDVPQPPVVSSPNSFGTRRKFLGWSRITKSKSILIELDLDSDDKTFIKVVSDEDSEDEAPVLWSAFAGWEDLLKLYGLVVKYYENHHVADAGLDHKVALFADCWDCLFLLVAGSRFLKVPFNVAKTFDVQVHNKALYQTAKTILFLDRYVVPTGRVCHDVVPSLSSGNHLVILSILLAGYVVPADSNDNDNAHVPKVKPRAEWLKHVLEEDQPASPKPEWVIPLNELPEFENNWADALAETYRDPDENKLISKTGDMGSFVKWYCKWTRKKKLTKSDLEDQVDLVNLEGHRIVPNVSELLPLGGPPGQIPNMQILSVISLTTYERYGYTYLKEIVLSKADYNEKRVEDLQLGIESYQTKLNLEQPNWDAFDFLFKEYYTIVYKPRAVIYRDKNDQKRMMRENEVHKFSDGTLMRIWDKLAYMVKDFKLFKYNKGMENRI